MTPNVVVLDSQTTEKPFPPTRLFRKSVNPNNISPPFLYISYVLPLMVDVLISATAPGFVVSTPMILLPVPRAYTTISLTANRFDPVT